MKARLTTAEHKKYEEALNSPSSDVLQQINKVPKLVLITYFADEVRGNIHQLFVNKTLIVSSDDEYAEVDTLEAIGLRLQDAISEEYFHVEIEWQSIARATARLLNRESEYQADIELNGDFYPANWMRLCHDNIYLLAYHIQFNEAHEYIDKG
ncbi:MAG: hypothetical protein JXQ95_06770 [Alteromonas stellipolaris]|uniref:hypothetical protein n=1 Tax=Alteromonas stellipolaris TaxID=233316 RepID=UPI003B8BBEF6